MSYLNIQNLEVMYSNGTDKVHALNGVNLSLEKGQTLGLVGETGAGKSTTALSIMRLLPERTARVIKGSILFDGMDLLTMSEKEMQAIRGSLISMIFQDPMTSLNPVLTVGEQIREALLLHLNRPDKPKPETRSNARRRVLSRASTINAVENDALNARTEELLDLVGIDPGRKNQYPHAFSGGMKQRVVIAMALACSPMLLIADEPTTALDVTIQAQVLAMIEELKKKFNMSMIMITHDLGIVAETCDHIAVMYAGEIIESGSWEDFFLQSERRHPYTQGLFGSIPNIYGSAKRLTPIEGLMPDPTDLPIGCRFHPRCPKCTDICKAGHPSVYISGTHMIMCHLFNGEVCT